MANGTAQREGQFVDSTHYANQQVRELLPDARCRRSPVGSLKLSYALLINGTEALVGRVRTLPLRTIVGLHYEPV